MALEDLLIANRTDSNGSPHLAFLGRNTGTNEGGTDCEGYLVDYGNDEFPKLNGDFLIFRI